jgi:hypothetical protein
MAFCSECGDALPEKAKFCPSCATAVGMTSGDPQEAVPVRVVNEPKAPADFAAKFPHPGPVPKAATRGNVRTRLVALGNVKGRTKEEILSALGPPRSVSATASGCQLLQWQKVSAFTGSWHYALIFDTNGICGGITHQFSK